MTPTRRGAAVLLAALLAFSVLAASCGGSSKREGGESAEGPVDEDLNYREPDGLEPQAGGSIIYGIGSETDGWNPTTNRWAAQGMLVSRSFYDRLAEIDADGNPRPWLAESWEASGDFKTWTVKMREGVTFHDGDPLTAQDVRLNLEAHRKSVLTSKALSLVEEITDDGDLTLTVKMKEPWATFPVLFVTQGGAVAKPETLGIDPQTLEIDGNASTAQRKPVGTGPFSFVAWEIDRELKVSRYDDYWQTDDEGNQLPYLDSITFQPIPDPGNRSVSVQSGDLDIAQMSISSREILSLREVACTEDPCEDRTVKIFDNQASAEGEEGMMMVNMAKPPFDDETARLAVAHAINRQDLLTTVFQDVFEVANGPWAPGSPWYTDVSDQIPQWDPDLARKLADEYKAEHGGEFTFEFSMPVGLAEVEQASKVVAEQLNDVGIEAEVKSYEMTKFVEKLVTGDFQGITFQWFGLPDPDGEYVWLHSDSVPRDEAGEVLPEGGISLNFARLANPDVDRLLEEARATDDIEVRKEKYAELTRVLGKELPFMWLYHGFSMVAWRPRVHDVVEWQFPDGTQGQALDSSGAHPLGQIWVEQ